MWHISPDLRANHWTVCEPQGLKNNETLVGFGRFWVGVWRGSGSGELVKEGEIFVLV
jgi:hypothetical protein